MSKTGKVHTTAKKKAKRERRAPPTPTQAAQRFADLIAQAAPTPQTPKEMLEDWFSEKGVKWRSLSDFLSGRSKNFSKPELLAQFVNELTGKTHDPLEFVNAPGVRNFVADFWIGNHASDFLRSVRGSYVCHRPSVDDILEKPAESNTPDIHELELKTHGDSQPATFVYQSTTANGDPLGAWEGYAVGRDRYIFLCGFCRDAVDVAYFILTPHPKRDYMDRILVGTQSLLLPYPQPKDDKHAVSRHIVAIRKEADTARARGVADQWIETKREKSKGLVVALGGPADPIKR